MKNLTYALLSSLALLFVFGCEEYEPLFENHTFSATTDACDSIVIVPLHRIDYSTDSFEITDASISAHTLTLGVTYGGGC